MSETNVFYFDFETENNLNSENIYLSKVPSIHVSDDMVSFVDQYGDKFISLSSANLKYNYDFNQSGQGPSELFEPTQFSVNNNSVYIFNQSPPQLSKLGLNRSLERLRLRPNSIPLKHTSSRFLVLGDSYIFSNPSNRFSFTVVDQDSTFQSGLLVKPTSCRYSNLHSDEGFIYSVCTTRPSISVFDKNTYDHIKTFDFSEIYLFKENIRIENERGIKPNGNTMMMYVKDSYLDSDRLFLLVNDHSRNGVSDLVMVFDVKNGDVSFSKFGLLVTGYSYSSIAVDQNFLYTFNENRSSIQKYQFEIPN